MASGNKTDTTTETTTDVATSTDIFEQQKKTIETLVNVLAAQAGQGQPVYLAPSAAPAAGTTTNYVLWIAIAIGAYLLFKGKR